MANDAIVRFHAESSEYDQKLKKAIDQMQRMEQEVRRTGASFAVADKEELEFVRSLGQMQTQANSAKGQMREFTEAILTLTQQYRNLSEEERNGDHGRALAESIATLKGRAADLQDTIGDLNEELKHMSSDTSFADGMNLLTRTVGSCAAAITAWTGDSKEMEAVIKDLAKIGTTVAAVEQLTKAVQKQNLVMLKNPYIAAAAAVVALGVAIGKLIQKAKELDGVQKALNEVQAKGREDSAKEITRIESLSNILHDNTRSLEERKTALQEIQSLVPEYHGALTEEGTLIDDNTGALDDYIDGLQRAAIAQAAFDKMVELQKKKMQQQVELQKKQQELQVAKSRNEKAQNQVVYAGTEMTQVYTQMDTSSAERAVQNVEADIRATNAEIDALRNLVKANDLETGNNGSTNTKTKGGTTTTTTEDDPAAGSIAAQEKRVAELTKKWKAAADDPSRQTIKAELDEANRVLDEMRGKVEDVSVTTAADMWVDYNSKLNEVKDRLAEFQEMLEDVSLSDDQRSWAAGMAAAYQAELDKMTGATEDAVDDMTNKLQEIPSSFDMFKDGVGAVGSLVGALDNLKNVGDDLAAVFSGEMDAWDSLMTVLNSGLSILQTVTTVYEAINTLTEIGTALKMAHAAAATTEATSEVTAATTEVAAEGSVAAAAGTATAAKAGEAAAGAGSAMSGIPFIGPVLAVAAIAAVLAAVMAAVSKSKSANSYATGGIVGGNSPSGDNVISFLNSGEGVLTKQGIANAGALMEAGSLPNNLHLSTEISGTNLRVVLDNDNRSKGGSRGAYSRIK